MQSQNSNAIQGRSPRVSKGAKMFDYALTHARASAFKIQQVAAARCSDKQKTEREKGFGMYKRRQLCGYYVD